MATTPPIYSFPGLYYNPVFFPSISGFLTLSQANTLYLARSGVASSVAILTSFTGAVTINGLLTLNGGLTLTGGLTVDTLTVNTLSTLNTNTIINNILTINATNSIVGQTTFTLAPILPSGYQFLTTGTQTITGLKTFSSVITSVGINDSLSITSPTITGSTIVNGGTFNATNIAGTSFLYGTSIGGTLACNIINNTSSTLPYILNCGSVPIPTTTSTTSGMGIGWNSLNGGGTYECDLINYGQGGNGGGFNFSTITNALVNRNLGLLSVFANGGFTINPACGQLRIQDINSGAFSMTSSQQGNTTYFNSNGISTSVAFPCGNASGVLTNVLLLNTNFVAPYAPLTPQSTTAFNFFHPTTTLGNNISTNTTQYATVGYVNSSTASLLNSANVWTNTNTFNTSIPTTTLTPSTSTQFSTVGYVTSAISSASLLPLNNTFTGLNTYTQRIQMTINTDTSTTCIGTNAGASLGTLTIGSSNTYYGYNAGAFSVNPNSETIVGAGSGPTISGSFNGNTVLGAQSVFNGSFNTILGISAGNLSTTVVYNNSTCIGSNSRITASNQITLGTVAETVLMPNTLTVQGLANILGFSVLPNLPTTYIAPTTTQIGYNFSQVVTLTSVSGWVNYPANQLNTMPFGTYQVNACLNLLTSAFSTITQYTLTIGTGLAVVNRNCAAQMGYYTANGSGSGATPNCITCACSTVYTGLGSNLNISVWTGTFQANCQLTWNVIRIA